MYIQHLMYDNDSHLDRRKIMKPIIAIIITVIVIITAGIILQSNLKKSSDIMTTGLDSVTSMASSENWAEATERLNSTEDYWEKTKKVWSMSIDHAEIDNIESSLSRVKEYIRSRDKALSLGEISNLRLYISHIPQKELVSLENIF